MAISGKPQKPSPATDPAVPATERAVFDLINKGGSVAKTATHEIDAGVVKPMLVQLRLYPDLVAEIDAVRKAAAGRGRRHPSPSRHAWIVGAIEEKLARDKSGA